MGKQKGILTFSGEVVSYPLIRGKQYASVNQLTTRKILIFAFLIFANLMAKAQLPPNLLGKSIDSAKVTMAKNKFELIRDDRGKSKDKYLGFRPHSDLINQQLQTGLISINGILMFRLGQCIRCSYGFNLSNYKTMQSFLNRQANLVRKDKLNWESKTENLRITLHKGNDKILFTMLYSFKEPE